MLPHKHSFTFDVASDLNQPDGTSVTIGFEIRSTEEVT